MKFRMQLSWFLGVLMLAQGVSAQPGEVGVEDDLTAHDVVQTTTTNVMEVVDEAKDYAEQDPERYYQAIQEILDPVVDFRGFARGVMGPYATSERYLGCLTISWLIDNVLYNFAFVINIDKSRMILKSLVGSLALDIDEEGFLGIDTTR